MTTATADRAAGPHPVSARKPHVVMVVLDDLGFADLGCFGSEIHTPRINSLAESGLRYNSFHVTALCAPSRASLLTGRNHHAVGMGFLSNFPIDRPGYNARLPHAAGTLPRILRSAGYNTFAVGKWHLVPPVEAGPAGPFDRWPLGLGFDRFYGFLEGSADQWSPLLARDNGLLDARPAGAGYHLTEDLASQAIRLVQDQQQAAPEKPFFLYFAPAATHWPHQVDPEWIEPYAGQYDQGWEAIRHLRYERQGRLGVIPPTAVATERPSWVAPWPGLSDTHQRVYARQMEVYAAYLTHADAQIGRIVDYLTVIGQLRDTIFIVLSDNGAAGESRDGAFDAWRGPNDIEAMAHRSADLGGYRSSDRYAWGWAWAGNTPFKLWKAFTWLGGVRVPLIVHWPNGIPTEDNGLVRPQFTHAIDLMPTILDAAGVELPEIMDGERQQRVDGRSFLSSFHDAQAAAPRDTQYFEMLGSRSIYHQGWKATTDHLPGLPAYRRWIDGSQDFATDSWSLYNLVDDFSESVDVSNVQPAKLNQLIEAWWYEAGRNQVLPLSDELVRKPQGPSPDNVDRSLYVCRPRGGPVTTGSIATGFSLTARVVVSDPEDCNGVIAAQGDWHGGWACYTVGGQLTFSLAFGPEHVHLRCADLLAAGPHDIVFTFSPGRGDRSPEAVVTVDQVAQPPLSIATEPQTLAAVTLHGRLLVGRDTGFPVCDCYTPPFPFTGEIDHVTLQLAEVIDRADMYRRIHEGLNND